MCKNPIIQFRIKNRLSQMNNQNINDIVTKCNNESVWRYLTS